MDWFYASGGERKGPVPEDELLRLAQSGEVTPATLVWHAGMAEWRPFSEAGPGAPPPVPRPASPVGIAPQTSVRYAGFWIRFGAYVLDAIIIGSVQGILFMILFGGTIFDMVSRGIRGDAGPEMAFEALPMIFVGRLAVGLLALIYFAWCWTQYGATPGKMAFGLKVINPDGRPITVGQAIGRYFGMILSGIIMGIGFIMAGFDDQKRALHDRLVNTRVIRAR
jgi:uncharacterized RDD family membrane protein YckC